jgi:hypothetical protein
MTRRVAEKLVIGLALTWDGARWPGSKLSPQARAFLRIGAGRKIAPAAATLAGLLAHDGVREIRICWVPCLEGGSDVLSTPFAIPEGRRIGFRITQTVSMGDMLGVVYRTDNSGRRAGLIRRRGR